MIYIIYLLLNSKIISMTYLVIIHYVIVNGTQVVESLSVNRQILAVSSEEAIGKAYRIFYAETPNNCLIKEIISNIIK